MSRQRRLLRRAKLRKLGFEDYDAYLNSPRWKTKRAEYWASDRPHDCFCGETEGLQLHHTTYERVGNEALEDLTPLCGRCHAMIHVLERRGDISLDLKGLVDDKRAARYREAQPAKEVLPMTKDQIKRSVRSIKGRLRYLSERLERDEFSDLLDRIRDHVHQAEEEAKTLKASAEPV